MSFANSQVLGVAAQRAITDMRKDVEAHVCGCRSATSTRPRRGVLISRIMTDAGGHPESRRHRPRAADGRILTATSRLASCSTSNWQLTLVTFVILAVFGGGMATAFKRLRPLFRERGKITAEVTGRLDQSLGGVRIVKAYTAEKREELVFAKGAHRLLPQRRAVDDRRVGGIGASRSS